MSDAIDIDFWTEECRKCKEVDGYIGKYATIKGDTLVWSIPEELKAGCLNYENRVVNEGGVVSSAQRIINRLLSQIQHEESKKKP